MQKTTEKKNPGTRAGVKVKTGTRAGGLAASNHNKTALAL